ncbi:MAG: signal peptidase II [Myxococcota bacterium]|nr:signal peptidase II [Myxococcota bacterium]
MTDQQKKPLIALLIIFVACVAADQITKQMAHHTLLAPAFHTQTAEHPVCGGPQVDEERERFVRRHRRNVVVVDGFFDFRYVENCASAFGMLESLPEGLRYPFFLAVSFLAVLFIPYLYWRTPADQILMLYALPFVLAGAVGNLIDRLVFRYVIDFIRWYITVNGQQKQWPTFNIADAAIVVGIGLMVLQMLPRRGSKADAGRVKA